MNKKIKISLLSSLFISSLVNANEYQVRIPFDGVYAQAVVWEKYASLYTSWVDSGTPYGCLNWTPLASTVADGQTFEQSSTECNQKQTRNAQDREKNKTTQEIRNVGKSYVEEKVISNVASKQNSIGTMKGGLVILNPVSGVSGIYDIQDTSGAKFKAYVNMTDAGGNWVLIDRWIISPLTSAKFNDVVVKNKPLVTYTNDATNYPVVTKGLINSSSSVLFTSGNPSWQSLFGAWQSFPTFKSTDTVTSTGFPVSTPIGTKTMFAQSSGWPGQISPGMTAQFGLWPVYGNGGPCGGANVVGYNRICPTLETGAPGSHFDGTYVKALYIKANN